MLIPIAVSDLYKTHASFDHAASEQALAAKVIRGAITDSVQVFRGFGFFVDAEQLRQFRLHAETEFEGFNYAVDLRILNSRFALSRVELLKEIEFSALFVNTLRTPKIRNHS